MTVDELSEYLNVQKSLIYRMTYSKQIPHIKLGHRTVRFDPIQIKSWLADNKIGS